MTSIASPFLCVYCLHLVRRGDYEPGIFRCDAFPNGIPDAILDNEVDHRKPYEGDQGIQYEFHDELFDDEPQSLYKFLNKK